jgi:hypothetical protein
MKNFLYIILFGLLATSCSSNKKESAANDSTTTNLLAISKATIVNKDSCANGYFIKSSYGYNNFIIDNQAYILEKNMLFIKALDSGAPQDKLEEAYKKLTEQTQYSTDSLEKLCPFNGNVEFKQAGVELFKFYQEAWTEYKGLLEVTNKKDRVKAYDKIAQRFHEVHSKTEKMLEEKFALAHTKFSNDYTLHVRTTALHENLDSLLYLK